MTPFRYLHTRGQTVNLAFDILCLILLLVLLNCDVAGENTPTSTQLISYIQCSARSSNPVSITMYYSSEKQAWIKNMVADFNSRHISACDGPITVEAIPIQSGLSMQEMVNGAIQPDVWSPAGNVWLKLINDKWQEKYGSDIVATSGEDTPSLVFSPVVIAMWKPEALALGWPMKPIGWGDIEALSTNPHGWAAYGHPEWGNFKFGHTNPAYSDSGLDTVIAEYYTAATKERGLTIADVNNMNTQDFVANLESSVIGYGESTDTSADGMFSKGPSYLSAAATYENLVVQANEGTYYPHLAFPVVAVYPKEGTYYSDHPFVIPQASWVTPAKKAAAIELRNFLLAPAQQKKAVQYGFRSAIHNVKITTPIDSAHGVDLSQPQTTLQIPSVDVVNAIEASWSRLRRSVDVVMILDRSGTMNDAIGGISKIKAAKQSLIEFINLLSNSDGLGLTIFSNNTDILTPVTPLGPKRQHMLEMIKGITAAGSTRLYNTIAEQVQTLKVLSSKHIKIVIVLTDGRDNAQQLSLDQLISEISLSGKNAGEGVKVFTIAYGNDADVKALMKIANATGGQEYASTPQTIKEIYFMIGRLLGLRE